MFHTQFATVLSLGLFFLTAYAVGKNTVGDFKSSEKLAGLTANAKRYKRDFFSPFQSKDRFSSFNPFKHAEPHGMLGGQEKEDHSRNSETRLHSTGCYIQPNENGHVNIPEGDKYIGSWNGWNGCSDLRSVTFPSSVRYIFDRAFMGTNLVSVHFPSNVVEIGDAAFSGIATLTSISFAPNSRLQSISDEAFKNTGLTTVSLPSTLIVIGPEAFKGASLTSVSLPSSLLTMATDAFSTGVTVTVNRPHCSYDGTSYSCCMIEPDTDGHVAIPDGTIEVPMGAFAGCSRLLSVSIPSSVLSIGLGAFSRSSLSVVTFSAEGILTKIDQAAFSLTKLVSVEIPHSVKSMKSNCFSGISTLTSVTFAEDSALTVMEYNLFYGSKLTSVRIPRSVSSIGESAFGDIDTLASVTFAMDGALTRIDCYSFEGTALTAVMLPPSVESIEEDAFPQGVTITGLKPYCSYNTELSWPHNKFSCCMIQPDADGHVDIPEGTIKIPQNAFNGCSGLVSVTFPSSISSIGDYAFSGSQLTSVTIPRSVSTIGKWVFSYVNTLASVTFAMDGSLTNIDDYSFDGTALTAVTLPPSVEFIGYDAFPERVTITGLKPYCLYNTELSCCMIQPDAGGHVAIPEGTVKVPPYSFRGCSGLVSVTFPASVASIGEYAFCELENGGLTSLTSVNFAEDGVLTKIEKGAFAVTLLSSVSLPSSLEVIGDYAFSLYDYQYSCLNPQCSYDSVRFCRSCGGGGGDGGGGGGTCPPNSYLSPGDSTGNCVCIRGFIPSLQTPVQCSPCPYGKSTIHDGSSECVAMQNVVLESEKRCPGYGSMRNVLPPGSVSVKYMSSSEEKMLVFSGVDKAFFDTVSTVEVRFVFSYEKESVGGQSFPGVLSKRDGSVDRRILLPVPPYSGNTFFHLSFPSCAEHLLKPGQYISKLRLMFFSVQPEDMLTADRVVGCKDYYLNPDSGFDVSSGVCTVDPQRFSV